MSWWDLPGARRTKEQHFHPMDPRPWAGNTDYWYIQPQFSGFNSATFLEDITREGGQRNCFGEFSIIFETRWGCGYILLLCIIMLLFIGYRRACGYQIVIWKVWEPGDPHIFSYKVQTLSTAPIVVFHICHYFWWLCRASWPALGHQDWVDCIWVCWATWSNCYNNLLPMLVA